MKLKVTPEAVLKTLFACIFALLAAHLAGMVLWHGFGHDNALGTIALFRFDGERNAPTMFSTLQLSLAAALLLLIAATRKQSRKYWYFLSAVFLFLAADEYIGFHEMLAVSVARADSSRTLQFAWLLPYLVGVTILAALLIPFLLSLPRRTMTFFVGTGGVFVSAAIGIEALTGMAEVAGYPVNDPRQRAMATVEEFLEMSAISVFVYSLLDFLRNQGEKLSISWR